jgi:hypothetical protein
MKTRLKCLHCSGIEYPVPSGPAFFTPIGDLTSTELKKQYVSALNAEFSPGIAGKADSELRTAA